MNRRSFLGRALAGAAVVLGVRATVAEAAPAETLPSLMPGQRWEIQPGSIRPMSGRMQAISAAAPTFEAMQADCESRGCVLEREYNITRAVVRIEHRRADPAAVTPPDFLLIERYDWLHGGADERVSAWLRSLHEG